MNDVLEAWILDKRFRMMAIIDNYTSFIWTDRFDECGDFELEIPFGLYNSEIKRYAVQGNYVSCSLSKHTMLIEKIEYKCEDDGKMTVIFSGRSIECFLERRIVMGKVEFSSNTNLQNGIKSLINTNIISPTDPDRQIENFVFSDSVEESITELTFSNTYNSENLLDIITKICQDKHIGFELIYSDGLFTFSLLSPIDRSYRQNSNPFVIFSPYYDNLKSSNYTTSIEEYRNFMVVSTGEETYITVYSTLDSPVGLERREVHEDADSFKTNKSSTISNSYLGIKAKQKLKLDYKKKTGFEAEIFPNVMYSYGVDYEVGDYVQLVDIYENSKAVRITEIVISCDEEGLLIVPTFEEIEEG